MDSLPLEVRDTNAMHVNTPLVLVGKDEPTILNLNRE